MRNKIEDLRNHLFETIEALKDKDHPMDLERAKTISAVAQTIINSAKVECDFMQITGGKRSKFIPHEEGELPPASVARLLKSGTNK
jgi:hypothetical protein